MGSTCRCGILQAKGTSNCCQKTDATYECRSGVATMTLKVHRNLMQPWKQEYVLQHYWWPLGPWAPWSVSSMGTQQINKMQRDHHVWFWMRLARSLTRSDRRATYNDCTKVSILRRSKKRLKRDEPVCLVLQQLQQNEDCAERYLNLVCVGVPLIHLCWVERDGRVKKIDRG